VQRGAIKFDREKKFRTEIMTKSKQVHLRARLSDRDEKSEREKKK